MADFFLSVSFAILYYSFADEVWEEQTRKGKLWQMCSRRLMSRRLVCWFIGYIEAGKHENKMEETIRQHEKCHNHNNEEAGLSSDSMKFITSVICSCSAVSLQTCPGCALERFAYARRSPMF